MKLITVREVAEMLNVTEKTIYNLIKRDQIPYIKVGGNYRFSEDEVIAYLKNQFKNKG